MVIHLVLWLSVKFFSVLVVIDFIVYLFFVSSVEGLADEFFLFS